MGFGTIGIQLVVLCLLGEVGDAGKVSDAGEVGEVACSERGRREVGERSARYRGRG